MLWGSIINNLIIIISLPPLIYIHASNTISFPPLSLSPLTHVCGWVCVWKCVCISVFAYKYGSKNLLSVSVGLFHHIIMDFVWSNKESIIMDFEAIKNPSVSSCTHTYAHTHTYVHTHTHIYKLYLQLFIIVTLTQTCDIFNCLAKYMSTTTRSPILW